MGILGSLMGTDSAKASNAAAGLTYKNQKKAIAELKDAGDEYATQYGALAQEFQPYSDAGESALARLMAGLGLGGDQEAFTASYRGLPGYEAGLETGGRAVAGNLNAGGMLQSGRAMKELQRFGSDYEDQRVGSYLDRLFGLSGMGQNATAQEVATVGQGLTGKLNSRQTAFGGQMTAAPTIGLGMIAGEQSKQNALTNLMGTTAYLGGSYLGGGFGKR